jgi:hypothetical protein
MVPLPKRLGARRDGTQVLQTQQGAVGVEMGTSRKSFGEGVASDNAGLKVTMTSKVSERTTTT